MILWDLPLLAIIRNLISMIGFSMLFLVLDQPRTSWKKTIFGHVLFVVAYTVIGALWMLWMPDSYVKWFTLTLFVGAVLFFPQMSGDTLLQSLYNISVQMFVHTLQLVVGIGLATALFRENPWAEIIIMCLYLVIVVWVYLRLFRTPYRDFVAALKERFRNFSIVSIIGCVFLIFYWTRPTFLMTRPFTDQLLYVCIWGLFLMTHLMMIKNMSSMYRVLTAENKIALVEMSNYQLNIQLSMIQDSAEETRRIRHDLRHHANLLTGMLTEGKAEDALTYAQKLGTFVFDRGGESYCENVVVNTILAYHLERARARGMVVACRAVVPEKISIDEMELCAALSNLLENATQHGGGTPSQLSVSILQNKDQLCIRIENSFDGMVVQDGSGNYRSTKPQSSGIGLKSVAAIVKKHHGVMNVSHTATTFTVDIALKPIK